MPAIPDAKVDEVRNATDIVDLVSRYIPLKRSGSGFMALCPFHAEKSPSFHVRPATQTFKCFGCGKGGNVFHFLMERERMTFPEAVRMLAKEAGIEVGAEERDGDSGQRERLFAALEWACRFFEAHLRSPAGAKAVEYLKRRKITGESAKTFRLGCSPEGWSGLLAAARKARIDDQVLIEAGLVRPGRSEPYDYFRDRLIFPIFDVRGRVVGFGGRTFGDEEPKYLNSPDTPLFHKGSMFYALNFARDEAGRRNRIGVVEGYTDAIMAHQHGVKWLVAGLGTGLTPEHALLARRYAERVDLVYDGDAAGIKAAERALSAFLEVEADVRVVELPGDLDPCDFLVERGGEAFAAALENSTEVFDFLLSRTAAKHDLGTLHGRIAAVDSVLAVACRAVNPVRRDLLLRRTAERLAVPEAAVRERLRAVAPRGGEIRTGPAPAPAAPDTVLPAERLLLEAAAFDPRQAAVLRDEWPPERFASPRARAVAGAILAAAADLPDYSPADVAGRLSDPAAVEFFAALAAEGEGKRDFARQARDCLAALREEEERARLREALREAAGRGDEDERRRLERELFQRKARGR